MKALFVTAAAAALVFAAPAAFADDGQTATTANVNTVCKIVNSPNNITVHTTVYNSGANIGRIKAGSGGETRTVSVFCNSPGSSLAITHTALTSSWTPTPASVALGFTNQIDFEAVLTGGREDDPTTAQWATAGGDNGSRPWSYAYGVYMGDLTLTIDKVVDLNVGKLPVDGAYAGSVQITMTPGV